MHVSPKFFITSLIIISLIITIIFLRSYSVNNLKEFEVPIFNIIVPQENVGIEKTFNSTWNLSIPKIGLDKVEIRESVEDSTLQNYIGHFSFSSYFNGNVCLAAHNAGFEHNYFANLFLLQTGDEIFYNYYNLSAKYIVDEITTISDKDFTFSYTDENDRITLITCISGSPSLRLCVKAKLEEDVYEWFLFKEKYKT